MSLTAWNAELDRLPWNHPRAIGRWLLWAGIGAMLAGFLLTPPWGKIGIAAAIVGALLARPPVLRLPVMWIGAALAGWVLLSAGAALIQGDASARRIPGVAYAWLAIPLGAACAVDARWRGIALRALTVTAALAAAVGLLQFCVGIGKGPLSINPDGERFARAIGFCAVHLHFGFAGALLAPLYVARRIGTSPAWAWPGRGLALVILAISGARNGLVGGAAAIATTLMARGGRWLWGGLAAGLLLLAAIGGTLAITAPERFDNMLAGRDGRWVIWRTTAVTIQEHPLLGAGSRDAFKAAYAAAYDRVADGVPNEFAGGVPHAHNWMLTLAADHGLPAAALHLALVGTVVVMLWRRRREHPAAFQAGCGVAVAGFVCGMFEPVPVLAAAGAGFHAALGLCLGAGLAEPEGTEPCPNARA